MIQIRTRQDYLHNIDGKGWFIDEAGVLVVYAAGGTHVAAFGPGAWDSVVRITPPVGEATT